MKEINFSMQSTLEANYLHIELQGHQGLDEIAVRVIKEDCPEFLLPFRIVDINNQMILKYKLVNTVALEYADKNMSKQQFLKFYLNLLTPFIKGGDWFLDYHYFCVDPRYVYVDGRQGNVYFVYVPERSYRNEDEEILEFFKNAFTGISILDDAAFQVKLYQFFAGKELTLSGLYQVLSGEEQKQGTDQYKKTEPAPVREAPGISGQNTGGIGQMSGAAAAPKPVQPSAQAGAPSGAGQGFSQAVQSAQQPKPEKQKPEKKRLFGQEKPLFGQPEGKDLFAQEPESGLNAEASDAVMEALFGGKKKKEKEPPLKKKEGGLFGKKKKETANKGSILAGGKQSAGQDGVQSGAQNGMQTGAQTPGQPAFAGSFPGTSGNQGQAMSGFAFSGEDDRTEISGEEAGAASAYLELIESPVQGAIPYISLDFAKPFIIIGRASSDEVQPDIAFGREFSRIGRKHARIEKRGEAYFVIDLGSANHTLLNGQVLIPNQPYQLPDGGELAFTNSKPVRYRIHL